MSSYVDKHKINIDSIINAVVATVSVSGWSKYLDTVSVEDGEGARDDCAYIYFLNTMDDGDFFAMLKAIQQCWKHVEYVAAPTDHYLDDEGEPDELVDAYIIRLSKTGVKLADVKQRSEWSSAPKKGANDLKKTQGTSDNSVDKRSKSDNVVNQAIKLMQQGFDPKKAVRAVSKNNANK